MLWCIYDTQFIPDPILQLYHAARYDAPHVHAPDKHATRKTIREDQPEETSSLPHFIRHSGRGTEGQSAGARAAAATAEKEN